MVKEDDVYRIVEIVAPGEISEPIHKTRSLTEAVALMSGHPERGIVFRGRFVPYASTSWRAERKLAPLR